jgi:hypothetical protein
LGDPAQPADAGPHHGRGERERSQVHQGSNDE